MLTARQNELLQYLLTNSTGEYICKEVIVEAVPGYQEFSAKGGDGAAIYSQLKSDIRAINNADDVQQIVVSCKTGYKIGDRAEVKRYLQKRKMHALRSLKLTSKLYEKAGYHGQMFIDFDQLHMTQTYMEGN